MKRREFLKKCSVIAGGVALTSSGFSDAAALLSNKTAKMSVGKRRPNIVIMLAAATKQLRWQEELAVFM